jgi:hypothetical protein
MKNRKDPKKKQSGPKNLRHVSGGENYIDPEQK